MKTVALTYSHKKRAFSLNCVNSFIDTPAIHPQIE
jgi:hypothetical protein